VRVSPVRFIPFTKTRTQPRRLSHTDTRSDFTLHSRAVYRDHRPPAATPVGRARLAGFLSCPDSARCAGVSRRKCAIVSCIASDRRWWPLLEDARPLLLDAFAADGVHRVDFVGAFS
jgi:hypothetical protein